MTDQIAKLRADHDAMGHELIDGLETGEVTEMIERDDGYLDGRVALEYFADFADWPVFEQEAMSCLVPGRVLDIGCGAGRAELYLQQQGVEVVGIDNSPLAVEVCRLRGVKDARLCSITRVGPHLGSFDNILMLGNNWGLMGSFKRARWLLRKFYQMTSPGARIIAQSNDIYRTTNPAHLAYQAWNRQRGRMAGQIRFRLWNGLHRSPWMDYLMVSQDEMKMILSGTGWMVQHFIESEGSGYIAIIEKVAPPSTVTP
jgi:SAM-dependent methyltransferase